MRNLTRPQPPYINHYVDSLERRNNPRKRRLDLLKPRIDQAYGVYEMHLNADTLSSLNPLTLSDDQKEDLKYCYEHDRNILFGIIKSTQPDELQSSCQYCGLGESSTLDHFVPQAEFPEFSIFLLNLVLSCYECNKRKLESWRANGSTVFLHLYRDQFEYNQFLRCEIVRSNGILVPEFYLRKSPQITERLFKRIEEHFNRLGLFGRFESASNSIVSEIRKSILGSRLVFTRNQKKKIVLREVNIKKQVYGINNWRTALIEGLSTSSEFLDSISSSYRVGTPKWVRDKILGVP